ncbi:TetR/AcrR family transcriptional regulator [Nocardia rhizosphaerae]|uniref:TetR/AcrR family transcriptional regulator n=1 Tax=Nocardia rhizosphaerae TaxID=1691571 RepID=A0ABV8LB76_9NOCA
MPVIIARGASGRGKAPQVERSLIGALSQLLGDGIPFSDITIEQLAGRAGISRPMFYYYFEDKVALLAHAFEAAVPLALYARQQVDTWTSGELTVSTALEATAELVERDRDLFAAAIQVSSRDDAISALLHRTCDTVRLMLTEHLRSAQTSQTAVSAQAESIAFGLTILVRAMVRQLVAEPDVGSSCDIVEATTVVWERLLSTCQPVRQSGRSSAAARP